jgi:hypothetical protein
MKKYLFLNLLVFIVYPIYSQVLDNGHFTFQMIRNNSRFFGYYLPLDFVEDFEMSRDWYSSRKYIDEIDENEYIYIRIDVNGIWVQEPIIGDGFSEELIDYRNGIENYQYEIRNNNEIIIFKNNGKKYKKISNTFEYDYDATINNYLGRIVLQDFILSGEIILENNIITIPALDFGKFKIVTWGCFIEYNTNLLIYGFNRGWNLDLNVDGDVITIYTYARWIFANRSGRSIYWNNKM